MAMRDESGGWRGGAVARGAVGGAGRWPDGRGGGDLPVAAAASWGDGDRRGGWGRVATERGHSGPSHRAGGGGWAAGRGRVGPAQWGRGGGAGWLGLCLGDF